MQDEIVDFYSQSQVGGSMPAYAGSRRVGGGFLGNLMRFALPLLKSVGRRALNVASRTADDMVEGRRSFKDSLMDNAQEEVRSVLRKHGPPTTFINKTGEGDIFSAKRLRQR